MQVSKEHFDKYAYYQKAVQSPNDDADFIEKAYWRARGREAKIMREDFAAAFALTCSWTRKNEQHVGIAVDFDQEPLDYGKKHYLSKLNPDQQSRVQVLQENVLKPELPKADVIAALNFSYMGFKERNILKDYFKNCLDTLNEDGILMLDCFGGAGTQEPNVHETEHDNFSYYWDQDTFNPVTNESQFYIHFKLKGEKKRERVFSYDWRLWSLTELRDLLQEVGFKSTVVYWEGTDDDGDGDGIFTPTETGDECESWVAYIVALR
tara:strand:+ start:900 stop:1694 length:795 start_codon:yes stop_codon:yes gene_type:complete